MKLKILYLRYLKENKYLLRDIGELEQNFGFKLIIRNYRGSI